MPGGTTGCGAWSEDASATTMRSVRALRIGIACRYDPTDRAIFSGMPASLLEALRETVADAVPLGGEIPRSVNRALILGAVGVRSRGRVLVQPRPAFEAYRQAAQFGRGMLTATSLAVRARMARAGRVDGCVLLNTELTLARSSRIVTYQDSTLAQALRSYPWPHLRGWSASDRRLWIGRQGAVYERAVACAAISHWAARSIVSDYGIDPSKVHVVGLGPNQPVRRVDGRDWSVPRFLFVGFDWERKNGDAVVAAFAEVHVRHPEATLDLVGGHPHVDAAGVTGHGRLSLSRDADRARLAALFERATVLVLPSLHEPSATVHLEAGHAGIPSIGSTNGGAETVIGPGGYVVDPGDRRGLAQTMERLTDPNLAAELGAKAQRHAELFTWRKTAERLVRALAPLGVDRSGLAAFL